MRTIESILKDADVTTEREWARSTGPNRIKWELGADGGCETADVDFWCSMLAVIPHGAPLPSFGSHELSDLAATALTNVVVDLFQMDGIDATDPDASPTIATSVPDDGVQMTFGANACVLTIRVHVTGHVTRALHQYV